MMDQPDLDTAQHLVALKGLRRVNLVSGVAFMMWRKLKRIAKAYSADRPMRVLDVACGGGDVAIQLSAWAKAAGLWMEIHGCDISPTAIHYAQTAALGQKQTEVRFFRLDVLKEPFPDGFDVVICSLFLHHLKDLDAELLLRKMAAGARRAVFVDDLLRSTLGFVFCWIGSRLLSRSQIVHDDGIQSVRAAFTISEAQSLAQSAGLKPARFQRRWPERFFMSCELE